MCDSYAFETAEWGCIVGGARQLVVKILESITKSIKNGNESKIIISAVVDKIEKVKSGKEIRVTYNDTTTIDFTHVISTTTLPAFISTN